MEVNKIQEGRHTIYILSQDPDSLAPEIINPTCKIELEEYEANDLHRYCTKEFYDQGSRVDYNKTIITALKEYLDKHIGKEELAEIEAIKKDEAKRIEESRKKEKPKFPWDLSKRKEKK